MDVAPPLSIRRQILRFTNFGIFLMGGVDHILHTFSLEILLPHIVVILPELDIKISALNVKSLTGSKS